MATTAVCPTDTETLRRAHRQAVTRREIQHQMGACQRLLNRVRNDWDQFDTDVKSELVTVAHFVIEPHFSRFERILLNLSVRALMALKSLKGEETIEEYVDARRELFSLLDLLAEEILDASQRDNIGYDYAVATAIGGAIGIGDEGPALNSAEELEGWLSNVFDQAHR